MAGLCKLLIALLLLAPITFCNAKGWLDWLYGEEVKAIKKTRLSVIPGILRDQIASMRSEMERLPHGSKERELLVFRMDQRSRQIENIKLISRGMPIDDFDKFVRLDDELALLRAKLRPHAHDEERLRSDADHKRMLELAAQVDATRNKYGLHYAKGQQPPEVVDNYHKRHMSEFVVSEVQRLRKSLEEEEDEDKIRAIRKRLDDLYKREVERKQPTAEELEVVNAETANLENERELVKVYLENAHRRKDDNAIHLGRLKMRKIREVVEQSVMQRVLLLRKKRDLELKAKLQAARLKEREATLAKEKAAAE